MTVEADIDAQLAATETAEETVALRGKRAHRMTTAEYVAIDAINWSSLHHIQTSPLMYRWRTTHREGERRSPALVLGSAIHCAILEPAEFDVRYQVYDGIRRGEEWDRWVAEHPGVESLKPEEMGRVDMTVAAVQSHRVAADMVRGGRAEEVVTWTDAATGLRCKARMDYLRPDFVLDLKSTRDPAPRRFARDAANLGYVGQLAWYHDGATTARLIDGETPPRIVAVQSDEPFDVACYQLDAETLACGRRLHRSLLEKLRACIAADYWPGVAPELQYLMLPAWADIPPENEEDWP